MPLRAAYVGLREQDEPVDAEFRVSIDGGPIQRAMRGNREFQAPEASSGSVPSSLDDPVPSDLAVVPLVGGLETSSGGDGR
jgi:hypothetical protein